MAERPDTHYAMTTQHLTNLLAVFIGSALGGTARYWVGGVVQRRLGERFPWGTLAVNVTGALLIGVLAALAQLAVAPMTTPEAQRLLIVGICGSYTTVSSFALQTLALSRDGQHLAALGNILGSLLLCLAAVWMGLHGTTAALGLAEVPL